MSDETVTTDETTTGETATEQPRDAKTGRFRVRLSHPDDRKRVVFSSVDEKRARRYLENNFPRGSTAYLETPDGSTEHYEPERADEKGRGMDAWGAFDPDAYEPPGQAAAPGESDWADTEG